MRVVEVAIAAAMAAACTGCPPSPPVSQLPDGQAAIDRLRASTACAQAVRVEDASASVPKVPIVKLGAMALAERPDHFRVDLTAFGKNVGAILCDGTTITIFDAQTARTQRLPASAESIASALGIGVTPNVIVALLLGRAPVLVHSRPPTVRWESGRYIVELDGTNEWHERIEMLPRESDWQKPWREQRMRLMRVRVSKGNLALYDAHLDDHREVRTPPPSQLSNAALDEVLGTTTTTGRSLTCDDVELPMEVEIESGGRTVALHEKKTALNPPIDPAVFVHP